MRTKKFFSILAGAVWTCIIGGVFAIIGVVVFFWPDLGTAINWPALTKVLPWYFWIALALFIWAIGFAWKAAQRIYVEPPELLELSKLRTEGIKLRGRVDQLKSEAEVNEFIDKYHDWEKRLLSVLSKLSQSFAEELAHIRDYPFLVSDKDINYQHSNHRSIIAHKLNKLEYFIDDYRKRLSNS